MERIRTQVRVVEVGPEEDGRKLLSFLEARLGRLPSGLYMRLVRSGQIRLDGRRCKPFDRVQAKLHQYLYRIPLLFSKNRVSCAGGSASGAR